ncbi:glycoside hydrolase family 43 protein [Evansella cellulosilytica]|uniref:Glycoside hydrolase family 43 n=1 Tax=Evansella cellulosilytica (strain ATCC 21833 / DSM 2522 / FERM P-1141 / JCM 9156 / N-4) TaxID=649639 RepID=E6TQD7_EVAC2|nr:glycoside hydrolase family 43 protein [Evansella cellulosilytica]ADU29315.1 glycoside hydrolase family 43 [Evansella cellulosilytica DSM 2522]
MGYKNPVISIQGMDHGDPAVCKYNGKYYLYHTGPREIRVYESVNLIDWELQGIALHASDDPDHWAQIGLWAPEIIHENGTFYMYVTAALMNSDGSENDDVRRIGVATSKNPLGPFTLAPQPLTDEWSIDAHPFKDEDGTYYMFYNVRNEYTRGPNGVIGTGNVVDRMADLTSLSGNPTMVVKPEHLWEGNKDHSFFWNEGPFVLKRNGKYFQMYSAGFFGDDTYGVYYATSDTPKGEGGMEDTSWSKWGDGEPILRTNEACLGPGHHVVVKGPDGVGDYIIYHGYEPGENVRERRVRVGRFRWNGDNIWLEPPSLDTLPTPTMPTFDGRFLPSISQINEQLLKHMYENYFFETNVRTGGKSASGDACYVDEANAVRWIIDPKEKTVKIYAVKGGEEMANNTVALQANFNEEAYHLFQVEKRGSVLKIFLNKLLVAEVDSGFSEGKGIVRVNEGKVAGTILTKLP